MSLNWTQRPFLSIDTETTGVDTTTARIVEIAAVLLDPTGDVITSWGPIVNPGVPIPSEASAIHGITTERAQAEGIEPAEALGYLAAMIGTLDPGTPVVIYNAGFDWPLIITEAERHRVDFPAFVPILDPYLLDRMFDKYRKGKRQLTAVAAHYGVEFDGAAHGAVADATASGRVMRAIATRHHLDELTLATLWARQVAGYEDWRAGFVEYMRRTNPAFTKAPGWPIPAGAVAA